MGIPGNARNRYPEPPTSNDFRFTTNRGNLYATGLLPPADRKGGFEARLTTFKKGRADLQHVSLLDGAKRVEFMQTEEALICIVPALDAEVAGLPYTLKLEGSMSGFEA
ncbi:MAG TPA: hypothetical protein VI320_39830 [Terracidiphilus sp.]|jgi:hypothetical protein